MSGHEMNMTKKTNVSLHMTARKIGKKHGYFPKSTMLERMKLSGKRVFL
jgi:hypothetical protein